MASASRVACLYDIHGNIAALDSVLEDIEAAQIETILVGGDIVWGPWPMEVLRRLSDLGDAVLFIRGNADREVAARVGEADGVPAEVAEVTAWCHDVLNEDQRVFLRELPETLSLEVPGLGEVLFCHGSPRSDEECLTPATPDERLDSILSGVRQPVVACGHTHVQFDRRSGRIRVVNSGSVGMPYEGAAGAYWSILGPDVELRRTSYDHEAAARAISTSGCPHGEEMFGTVLLEPPDREAAIAAFEPGVIPDDQKG